MMQTNTFLLKMLFYKFNFNNSMVEMMQTETFLLKMLVLQFQLPHFNGSDDAN